MLDASLLHDFIRQIAAWKVTRNRLITQLVRPYLMAALSRPQENIPGQSQLLGDGFVISVHLGTATQRKVLVRMSDESLRGHAAC